MQLYQHFVMKTVFRVPHWATIRDDESYDILMHLRFQFRIKFHKDIIHEDRGSLYNKKPFILERHYKKKTSHLSRLSRDRYLFTTIINHLNSLNFCF